MSKGRARNRYQSDAYAFRLWNGPHKGIADEGALKAEFDSWIANQCQQINPDTDMPYSVSEAVRLIVHNLIRHWMGVPSPAETLAAVPVDVKAIAEQVRGQVLHEVRVWLEQMREDGYRAPMVMQTVAAEDAVDPVTADVIDNILADFNGEFD